MVRTNTQCASYGTTSRSFAPPPPYSDDFAPRNEATYLGGQLELPGSPSLFKPSASWIRSPSLIVLITFILTVGLWTCTMPITYCNDPADPQVRERIRGEWNKELLAHERQAVQRELIETQWVLEDERHAALLRAWEQERIDHERELKERAQREEDERVRLNLSWGHVETHQCTTYGTREYTAVLMNLPMRWGRRLDVCRATPLEVHGVKHLPKSCEMLGRDTVIGRWEINIYEPDCNTYWNWYKDKGCTSHGSGKRRIEHYMENLPKGGDWREFCATTPARFHDMEFAGAQECYQWNYGTYGLWEIDDANC